MRVSRLRNREGGRVTKIGYRADIDIISKKRGEIDEVWGPRNTGNYVKIQIRKPQEEHWREAKSNRTN